MKKVIAINLNGNAYQVDEDGFNELRQYLDRAEAQLKDNPDKLEIISDLEQAIGEKCAGFLSAQKTVVTGEEVEQIIKDMGPVDSGDANATQSAASEQAKEEKASDANAPKRLYQIQEGAVLSGVCQGIAAFFDIDATIVRVVFIILAIVTQGAWALVYVVMMLIIPCAKTTEQRAAAHGAPFNAQEVIDQAKLHYSDFKDKKEWRRHWREQRRERKREWKRRWREGSIWWLPGMQRNAAHVVTNVSYGAQIIAGILVPILGIANVLLFWAWLFAIISLATTSTVFGWPLPVGMPLWAGFVALIVAYNICAWPLKAIRRSWYYATRGNVNGGYAAWDGMLWLVLTLVVFWFAYENIPQVHYVMNHFSELWSTVWEGFNSRAE